MFKTKDKLNKSIVLKYLKTNMFSKEFCDEMGKLWEIAKPAYIDVEVQFLKAHPELVGSDLFYKPLEDLFKKGAENIDWIAVEQKMEEILKGMFVFDVFSVSEDIKQNFSKNEQIIIKAIDEATGKILGFLSFMFSPEFKENEIKCVTLAVLLEEQNKGLGKLLMASIFKIMPEITRIFLCTRVTNETARHAYLKWGFRKDPKPNNIENGYVFNLEHWDFFEYLSDKSNLLQDVAKNNIL